MKALTLIAASDEYDSSLGFMIKGANGYDSAMTSRSLKYWQSRGMIFRANWTMTQP